MLSLIKERKTHKTKDEAQKLYLLLVKITFAWVAKLNSLIIMTKCTVEMSKLDKLLQQITLMTIRKTLILVKKEVSWDNLTLLPN